LPATSSGQGPDEQVVRIEERQQLRRAVSRLPEPERVVVLAYYLGDMSVAEISRALDMPEGTVKTRLHRGRQALRKELMVP
jgi:RNA polymerase sigma-70 factor (ECF subfamily)